MQQHQSGDSNKQGYAVLILDFCFMKVNIRTSYDHKHTGATTKELFA